jgi:predicted transcriptional regulator
MISGRDKAIEIIGEEKVKDLEAAGLMIVERNECGSHDSQEMQTDNLVCFRLTNRQRQIIDFIKSEIQSKGYPPTVREIAEGVGIASPSTVHTHLEKLEKKGIIRRDPTLPRTIQVLI